MKTPKFIFANIAGNLDGILSAILATKLFAAAALLAAYLLLTACTTSPAAPADTAAPQPPAGSPGTVSEAGVPSQPDAARLYESLVQAGYALQLMELNPPTALLDPVPGAAYQIGQGWLHMHWFPDEESAMQREREIPSDLERVRIAWVGEPHYFRCGAVIALSLGVEPGVLDTIQDLCGPPFGP